MTSNVGTKLVKDFGSGVGFNTKSKSNRQNDDIKAILEKELKKKFAPEFINRLDEIIYFRDLEKEDILKIVELELNKTIKRASELGFNLNISEEMKSHLIEVGYDPQYGARPLKRAIQQWIDDPITEYIIDNNPAKDTEFLVSYNKEKDVSIVTKNEVKKSRKAKKEDE